MPESGYVYINGSPIFVGAHGETDYIYHSGEAVPNRGDTGFVFETGNTLGQSTNILENFESGTLSGYTTGFFSPPGSSGGVTQVTQDAALEGTWGGKNPDPTQDNYAVYNTSQNVYRGQRLGFLVKLIDGNDSEVGMLVGCQSENPDEKRWINCEYHMDADNPGLWIFDDEAGTTIASNSYSGAPADTLLDFVVTWDDGSFGGSDGDITFSVYEGQFGSGSETLLSSVTGSQASSFTSGGYGWTYEGRGSDIDFYRVIEDRT